MAKNTYDTSHPYAWKYFFC